MSCKRERGIAETNEARGLGEDWRLFSTCLIALTANFHSSNAHDPGSSNYRLLAFSFDKTTVVDIDVDSDRTPLQDYPGFS